MITDAEILELDTLLKEREIDNHRINCLASFEYYIKYIQKEYYGYKPNLYDYQLEIVDFLNSVLKGKITRGIINLPPRYRKTEIAVKMFISYCLALNPKARFIHLSYSDDLALDNSEVIKDIIQSDCYQKLFPIKLKKDSKSKKKWYTEVGGGVYATSSGGQVTGFGAGKSIEEYGIEDEDDVIEFMKDSFSPDKFGGAIVLDDANKPEDAYSKLILDRINNRFDGTIKNRVNSRFTPIINIQQRIAKLDLSGYLLSTSKDWKLLRLQALKDGSIPLCKQIHTVTELLKLKEENENIFNNQYQQDPKVAEGLMYQLQKVDEIEKKGVSIAVVDPADEGKCYMACVFAYVFANKIWVKDIIYTQEQTDDTFDDNNNLIKKGTVTQIYDKSMIYKPYAIWIEKDGMGSLYGKQVKAKYPLVQTFNAKGNKDARIFDKAHVISKHFRFLKTSPHKDYENAIQSLDGYEKSGGNEFKDIQDALTSLAEICIKNNLINIYETN